MPLLEVKDLHKSFNGNPVLKGVTVRAERGDVIGVIGSSGSGKSTLLRCINFLEMADRGSISVGDAEVRLDDTGVGAKRRQQQGIARIRASASMVFQGFNLWSHRTVLENLIEVPVYVQKRDRKACVAEAEVLLERVGLIAKRDAYPSQLSGGQQQRVAIARALAVKPGLILLDEPTSALDPELVSEVLQVIQSLAEARTTMMIVTHELRFAREVSNKIIFLEKGVIAEEGPPAELFERPRSERLRQFLSSSRH